MSGLLAVVMLLLLVPAPALAQPSVTRHTLANGVRLLVREETSASVVAVSLLVRAGSRDETPATSGISNFLHRVMPRGTARRSGDALVEAAERLGGSVEASGEVDYSEVRGTALARNWEALLSLVAEVALAPTLAPEDVEKERRLILAQIRTRSDTPFSRAFDALVADVYGPHPYALPAVGRADSISRLTREDLAARHRAIYRAERLVLAVSGRVERERVVRAAERVLGGVATGGTAPLTTSPAPSPRGTRRAIEMPAQQAQVLVGVLGPSVSEPDYAAVKVLTALLGGGMSGRLFAVLRDREGLAYSTGAVNATRAGPSLIAGYAGTAPDNAAAVEAGMLREFERVRLETVSEDELARAKAYVAGALAMDRRTNARHAWYLAFYEILDVGWDFPERYTRAVERVTLDQLRAAADRYLRQPTIIVLRPR